MRHPKSHEMVERKIEVHKDKTLREATQEAYKVCGSGSRYCHAHLGYCNTLQVLGLTRLVALERCRLVRFDEYTETLDQSFDATQEVRVSSVVFHGPSYLILAGCFLWLTCGRGTVVLFIRAVHGDST